jgi:hypothetical protein
MGDGGPDNGTVDDERFENAPLESRYVDSRPEAEHVVGTDQS